MTRTTFGKGLPSCREDRSEVREAGRPRGRLFSFSSKSWPWFGQVGEEQGQPTELEGQLVRSVEGSGRGGVRVTTDPAKIQQEAEGSEEPGLSQLRT